MNEFPHLFPLFSLSNPFFVFVFLSSLFQLKHDHNVPLCTIKFPLQSQRVTFHPTPIYQPSINPPRPSSCPPVRSANYYRPYRYTVPVANRNRIAYKRLRGAFLGYNSLDPPMELWPAANWGNQSYYLELILNIL